MTRSRKTKRGQEEEEESVYRRNKIISICKDEEEEEDKEKKEEKLVDRQTYHIVPQNDPTRTIFEVFRAPTGPVDPEKSESRVYADFRNCGIDELESGFSKIEEMLTENKARVLHGVNIRKAEIPDCFFTKWFCEKQLGLHLENLVLEDCKFSKCVVADKLLPNLPKLQALHMK